MRHSTSQNTTTVAPGWGRRILLVDDDQTQLKLCQIQLEQAGFVVEPAPGANAAEELLRRGPLPAAILSDVVMDGIDGFDLCRRVRSDGAFASIPIVLQSSAFDEEEDQELAHRLGASALVSRSTDQSACIQALIRSLDERTPPTLCTSSPELYASRMMHQLVRLSERRTAAEARYGHLFEHANDAIACITREGIILDANRKWEEICGVSRLEMHGKPLRDFAAVDDSALGDSFGLVDASGRIAPTPVRRADGSTLFLEFTATTVELDGATMIMAIGRDVTSLVDANRKLEASERHYRSLVENVPDVIWSATLDWKYTFFSPNIERITGFTADDLFTGRHGASLARVHADDVPRVQAAREAMTKRGTPIDVQIRWQHRAGHFIWVHLRGARTATGIDGTFSDITARKELEEQLCQAQRLEAVGQLTAGVAHDFNNLLAVVLINASHLARLLPPDDPKWEIAHDIVDVAERGTALTKQLLAFSRRQPCAPKKLNLNELVLGMKRLLDRTVGSGIELRTIQDECLSEIHADPAQVEQLIMNLAVNARDAMAQKGTLIIETANVEFEGESGYVRMSISDDGCGMDAATLRRVFEPFFTTKPPGEGTGLGLATCYGIVRNAGGHISIDSEPGRGTTFHVYLPRAREVSQRMSLWASVLPVRPSTSVPS